MSYEYMSSIDSAIMDMIEDKKGTVTVSMVTEYLNDKGFSMDHKRVRNHLNSLVDYNFLGSDKVQKDTGGYCRIYYMRGATA